MEKKWSVLAILTSVLILSLFLITFEADAAPAEIVCCANPSTTILDGQSQFYCSQDFTEGACCPDSIEFYDPSNPSIPDNQQDCILNYIDTDCSALTKCDLGCCYDATESNVDDVCTASARAECEVLDSANKWQLGYDVDARQSPENPCYSSTKDPTNAYVSIFAECPIKDECTEADMTILECQQSSTCVYCPSSGPTANAGRCISQCDNCGDYSTDKDSNGECDADGNYQECSDLYCGEATTTCDCNNYIVDAGDFCCGAQSTSFSNQATCTANCFPNCLLDREIDDSEARYGAYFSSCVCGDQNIALTSDGICCDYGNQGIQYVDGATKCYITGEVSGTVDDDESDLPLEGVMVIIGSETDTTDSAGAYYLDRVVVGDYEVLTRYPNYKDSSTPLSITYDGQQEVVDIRLEPNIPRCQNPDAGEIDIGLSQISCTDGAKALTLNWNNPCPENILFFKIYRNDVLLVPMWQDTTYTDSTYDWDMYVNYTVEPIYDYFYPTYTYSTENKYTGNEECIGYSATEICIDDIRYECGACNERSFIESCRTTESCVGPSNDGDTFCKSDEICQELGVPFGIFYDPATCYGTSGDNYCYYDYSSTTIDWCTDCTSDTTCFDYLSEEACTTDNCIAFKTNNCVFDYTNQEFGKGICYEPDYEGTDYCDVCNDVFMNCDSQACSNLGDCFMFENNCDSCANAQCSEYTTEQDCTGGQEFNILLDDSCAAERTYEYSNDACGLNYCKWSTLTSSCFRDVDDDGVADEEAGDYLAPTTTAMLPQEYLGVDSVIIFNTTELSQTYYCIDMDGTCCPNNLMDTNGPSEIKSIVLPGAVPEALRDQGWYTLKYYSVDMVSNPEEVKQADFYGDFLEPNTTEITFDITNSTIDSLKSDLYISFTLSEYANCTDTLVPRLNNLTEELHVASGFYNQFQARYSTLYDAQYTYTITCTDPAGNMGEEVHEIDVDRFDIIFEESPKAGLISSSSETLSFKTEFEATLGCDYSKADSEGRFIDYYPFGGGTSTGTLDHHLYEREVSGLTNGAQDYFIDCAGDGWADTTRLYFSVDTAAPITELFSKSSNGAQVNYSSSTWYQNPTNFELVCTDEPQDSTGSIFGCGSTKWCECAGEGCACSPNLPGTTFTVTKPTTYCFASSDLGGNSESIICKYVKTDNIPPTLPFVDDTGPVIQYPEYSYETDKLKAKFNASDAQSGLSHYLIEIRSSENDSILAWTEKDDGDDWVWFDQDDETEWKRDEDGDLLDLENGTTYYFYVRAVDNAGNMGLIGKSDGITIDTTKTPDHCTDGIRNQGESDVDCGGISCDTCNLTSNCYVNRDCASGFCLPLNNTCGVATCNDGYMNGAETDIDCGGTCFTRCGFGEGCLDDADCASNDCDLLTGTCTGLDTSFCYNGVQDSDQGERGIDCGGDCVGCETGADCVLDSDCASGKCGPDGTCEAPSCDDGIENGDETDIDCGGSCEKCSLGNSCLIDKDCASGNCEFTKCIGLLDEDGDGLGDDWEKRYCEDGDCDPEADDDNDGLTNLEEYGWGTDPQNKDSDGDGYNDGKEDRKGTDPTDPEDHPKSSFFKWFLILLFIGLLGGGGYYYYQESQKKEDVTKQQTGKPMSDMFKSGATVDKKPKKEFKPLTRLEAETRSAELVKRRRMLKNKERESIFSVFDEKKGDEKEVKKEEGKEEKKELPEIESAPLKSDLDISEGKKPSDDAQKPKVSDKPAKPIKKKKPTGNVWDKLGSMNKEELKIYGKSDNQVHSKLVSMYGKRLDDSASKKISNRVNKNKITKSNIVTVFTELSKTNNLSKSVLKKILSRMVVGKKITQAESRNILEHLAENKAIKEKDILDILSYINSKMKDSLRK